MATAFSHPHNHPCVVPAKQPSLAHACTPLAAHRDNHHGLRSVIPVMDNQRKEPHNVRVPRRSLDILRIPDDASYIARHFAPLGVNATFSLDIHWHIRSHPPSHQDFAALSPPFYPAHHPSPPLLHFSDLSSFTSHTLPRLYHPTPQTPPGAGPNCQKPSSLL